jgi:nucleoside-diphosphate-sugar epimerase
VPIDEKHPFQGQSPYSATKIGALTPTRDFNYVKDTAHGFYGIFKSGKAIGEEINIATQQEISMGDLAQLLISKLNPSAKVICDEERLRPEKSEVNRLLGCNRKIMELTDWKPQYTFEQGVEETIDFLRENIDRYKSDSYNI